MDKPLTKPRIAAFEITRRCPLHCRHCRAAADPHTQDILSTQDCISILSALASSHRCLVILTGGEPMERSDFFSILQAGTKAGLRMALAACGRYLDDSAARRLKKEAVLSISFSLDGADAQTHDDFRASPGAFETVLKAIETARKAGLTFQINTTLTRQNLHEVDRIARLCEQLGASCWNPFVLVPVGRGEQIQDLLLEGEEYESLLESLCRIKQHLSIQVRLTCGPQFVRLCRQANLPKADKVSGCLAGRDFVFISYRGDVQPCGFLEISAGNLLERSFDSIWSRSPLFQSLRQTSNYKGACGRCSYLSICRGCRARAYAVYGDYLQQDPVCLLAQPQRGNQQ